MARYLIIANNAPEYFNLYRPMADEILASGGDVTFALDSDYSLDYNGVGTYKNYVFTDYVKRDQQSNEEIDFLCKKIQNEKGLWHLYPDFDRDCYYSIFSKKFKKEIKLEQLFSNLVGFFVSIFKKENFDYIVYENASNALALIARDVGKYYGVKYCGLAISRLPGRISITDDPTFESEIYRKIMSSLEGGEFKLDPKISNDVTTYLNSILNIQPDYMRNNPLNNVSVVNKYFNLTKIKILLFKLKYSFGSTDWNFQVGNPFLVAYSSFSRNVFRSIKSNLIKKKYDKLPKSGEGYFLYPLHFHPEASTSVLAKHFNNEYELIRNIAFSLPHGFKLYVKDHISAYGFPSLAFYNRLKLLPNIVLLSPFEDTKSLIKGSTAVLTLTSTVGYEALILEKPVIVFGNVFYDFHKLCYKCNSYDKISGLLSFIISSEQKLEENYNVSFVSSYFLATYEIKLDYKNCCYKEQRENASKILEVISENN